MKKKKAWDVISDDRYTEIWHGIREALNPGGRYTATEILGKLSGDEKAALFNRLCCDYGKCVMFSGDSKRKERLFGDFEGALELLRTQVRLMD
jgi:hypothetical protein